MPEVVVVTGASAGVGRATVLAFARRGAHVALLARGREGLAGAREDVEAAGGRALVVPTDVADPDQVEAAAETVEEELGPIDVWVNNAMASVFSPLREITPEEFKRATEVTYLGTVYGTMAALKRMLPRDRGSTLAGRFGALLPRHTVAGRLLRGQARDKGVYGFPAYRAVARREQRSPDDGAAPGAQHPAVRLVQDSAAPPPAAGAAHLSA